MKEISKLMEYRSDVKVVDATLRDGGLVNDFYFTDEFVKALETYEQENWIEHLEYGITFNDIETVAEQLKAGEKNGRNGNKWYHYTVKERKWSA